MVWLPKAYITLYTLCLFKCNINYKYNLFYLCNYINLHNNNMFYAMNNTVL